MYCKEIKTQILFDTGMGNKRRLLNVNDSYKSKGEYACSVLPALHCFTDCDTTSACVRRGKMLSLKFVERKPEYIPFLQRIGQDRQCSEALISDMEAYTCAIYGNAATKNVNKLCYDTFLKKYQDRLSVLKVSNGMDMSLLPLCQSALEMHIKKVNYQVFVWLHAHESKSDLLDIEESGWTISGEEINNDWVKGELIVPDAT